MAEQDSITEGGYGAEFILLLHTPNYFTASLLVSMTWMPWKEGSELNVMIHVYLKTSCLFVDFIVTIKTSVWLLSSKDTKLFVSFLEFIQWDGKVYMKGDVKYFSFFIV